MGSSVDSNVPVLGSVKKFAAAQQICEHCDKSSYT
jgi:hypothetical protein